MRSYLCGPMTGYTENNYPLFIQATEYLRKRGYEIVSPVECIIQLGDGPWEECLKADLVQMLSCVRILLLPKWEQSRGATLELLLAVMLGYEIWRIEVIEGKEPHFNCWQLALTKSQVLRTFCSVHFPLVHKLIQAATRL